MKFLKLTITHPLQAETGSVLVPLDLMGPVYALTNQGSAQASVHLREFNAAKEPTIFMVTETVDEIERKIGEALSKWSPDDAG